MVHLRTDQNWSEWSEVHVANQVWARPILDVKNGPAGLNLVNQNWSSRTSFGTQNRSSRTDFTQTDISVTGID